MLVFCSFLKIFRSTLFRKCLFYEGIPCVFHTVFIIFQNICHVLYHKCLFYDRIQCFFQCWYFCSFLKICCSYLHPFQFLFLCYIFSNVLFMLYQKYLLYDVRIFFSFGVFVHFLKSYVQHYMINLHYMKECHICQFFVFLYINKNCVSILLDGFGHLEIVVIKLIKKITVSHVQSNAQSLQY